MKSKRGLWIAEIIIGTVAIIFALKGNGELAIAAVGYIAATMDKLVSDA